MNLVTWRRRLGQGAPGPARGPTTVRRSPTQFWHRSHARCLNARQTSANCEVVKPASPAHETAYLQVFPRLRKVSRPRLKIVVSPVRVRVSPSPQFLIAAGSHDFRGVGRDPPIGPGIRLFGPRRPIPGNCWRRPKGRASAQAVPASPSCAEVLVERPQLGADMLDDRQRDRDLALRRPVSAVAGRRGWKGVVISSADATGPPTRPDDWPVADANPAPPAPP